MVNTQLKSPSILVPVNKHRALQHLRDYFYGDTHALPYTGADFDRLGGGGTLDGYANMISYADLLSLSMLQVPVRGKAVRALLSTTNNEIGEHLAEIPSGLCITTPQGQEVLTGQESPARKLWSILSKIDGFGSVRVSKLLARKRPHLIPVYDSVIGNEFGLKSSGSQWDNWICLMSDPAHIHLLRELQVESSLEDISLLRILDVIVWMDGKKKS